MKKSRVNRENYIVIQGWMVADLGLKGNELILYATIYGFSQAEDQKFTGSLQYLADWTNSTKQGVSKALKNLVEKKLIEKSDVFINGVKFCEYHTTKLMGVLNKVDGGMQQSLTGGIKQSLTNNIDLNNIDNIIEDKKESKKERKSFDAIIEAYTNNSETIELLKEWLKVRKSKRSAMTDRAIQMNIDKLDKLAKESNMTVNDYLSEVICRGWAAFYPINSFGAKKSNVGVNGIAIDQNKTSDLDEIF